MGHVRWHATELLRVGDHGSSIYITLVAVDLSSKRSYVRHPLSGKAASSVRSQFACYFVRSYYYIPLCGCIKAAVARDIKRKASPNENNGVRKRGGTTRVVQLGRNNTTSRDKLYDST